MNDKVPDRIEKQTMILASRARVWRALTDPEEFGAWFRVRLQNGFTAGRKTVGRITHPGYEHLKFEADVERVEPEHLLALRWHPYAIDPKVDYSKEPTTLVEFRLKEGLEGTQLSVTESGFDQIPESRRAEAYRMNEQGWGVQVDNIRAFVAG